MKQLVVPTIFTAVNRFSGPLGRMGSDLSAFSDKTVQKLNAVNEVSKKIATQSLIAGAAIAAPLAYAVKVAADYEKGLASLSAITGVTGAQFEKFQEQVISVSRETRRGPIEVAKAFELAGSAMPELLNSATALSAVSKSSIILAKASGEELEPSIRALTGVMNQFSLGAGESNRTINVLAAGAKVGAASIQQTSEAMVNFGSTAAGANLSVEKATAAIQVMSKFGLFGAEAGTKLRGSVLRLQQAGVGYASGQFNINDALAETKVKMDKLSTAKQRDAFLDKVFGAENISTGRILLNNIQLFEQYTKGVTGTSEATTQAGIRGKTYAARLEDAKAQMELLSITIGEKLLPYVNKFLDKMIPVIQSVVKWVKENPKLTKTIVEIAAGLAVFLLFVGVIASIVSGITSVITFIGLMGTAITGIATAFTSVWSILQLIWAVITAVVEVVAAGLGASVGVIVAAFAFLVSLVYSFYRNWEMITAAFKNGGIIGGLKAIGATILDAILYPLQRVLEIISKLPVIGQYAAAGAESIAGFRSDLGIQDAVNPKVAAQEGMVARSENTNNSNLNINVNDPTGRTTTQSSGDAVVTKLTSTMNFGS